MANQALLSPEKYIRTKARSLPVYECVINAGWEKLGIASIFVARRHSNGNITYGSFLVDIWCLGLKNTDCDFNIDIDDWNEIKDRLKEQGLKPEIIDYNLAHNIIFGGIAFAEEYGLKTHKDFSLSQFILEVDDESIPIIDVDFGIDGKPHVVMHPEDNKAKAAFNYLKANFDRSEFTFVTPLAGDFEDEDTDEDEKAAMIEGFKELKDKLAPRKAEIESLYQKHFNLSPVYLSPVDFGNLPFKVGDVHAPDYGEEVDDLLDVFSDANYDDPDDFIDELKQAAQKYPYVPGFWLIAADVYDENDRKQEAIDLLREKSTDFPNELYFIIKEIALLTSIDEKDEMIIDMGRKYYPILNQFAVNGILDKDELEEFFALLCVALAPKGFLEDAQICVDWLRFMEVRSVVIDVHEIAVLLGKQTKLVAVGLI